MSLKTLSNIKLPVEKSESELLKIAERSLKRKPEYFEILKKSLDARDKNNVRFVYTIAFSAEKQPQKIQPLERLPKEKTPEKPVLIVGSGPAGLFTALRLLDRGITPIVIDRGAPVEEREKKISVFFSEKTLDPDSNIQFGEGGAGTFSDGKLNTQTHSPLIREVLETFVRYGAPKEILWLNKPHIGSDNLKKIVKNMREDIIDRGGQVCFHSRLIDLKIQNGSIKSVKIKSREGEQSYEVSALVLAIGHSARDTFEMLLSRGVYFRQKDFAVGVRIEHLQDKIGFSQYGKSYSLLPAADYKLVSHASDRAAFTFCMCPGGFVMPAASEEGGVVTNGMSNYARDGKNANSALIAQVTQADFGEGALAGVEFQRRLERAAYLAGGKTYAAPVQKIGDFLKDKESSSFGEVLPTYAAGTAFADLRCVLPTGVADALKLAIADMEKRLKGFADPDGILTAVESRTSSPVRIERDENLESVSTKGLYPCGEGAGYAGGITSSAVDGLRVADAVYKKFV
ncbi:MAG: FAD-dependent monooxygenase [Clostridia bacterium]|nr:FAD-dependent monooxygenase [Clostridia bacterium]